MGRRQSLARQEALDRERLFRELTESESKFAKFAQRAPIGLAILTSTGIALSANELWKDLTQLTIGSDQVDWVNVLVEGELPLVNEAWGSVLNEKRTITIHTRTKRLWRAPEFDADGNVQWAETQILLALHPDFDDNGEVTTVMSCITDIR